MHAVQQQLVIERCAWIGLRRRFVVLNGHASFLTTETQSARRRIEQEITELTEGWFKWIIVLGGIRKKLSKEFLKSLLFWSSTSDNGFNNYSVPSVTSCSKLFSVTPVSLWCNEFPF
jgi:hypothetical protein